MCQPSFGPLFEIEVGKVSVIHRSRRGHVAHTAITCQKARHGIHKGWARVLFIALDGVRRETTFTAGREVSL